MMFQHFRLLAASVGIWCLAYATSAQTIPAFPGADGAAATTTGGRGGIVYHVTKLNSAIDDPERNDLGTLRYGLNSANFPAGVPRTIVFDVGGVFHLGRLPQVDWDPNGNGWDAQSRLTIGGTNITFAGQTAPGTGVIFMGGGLKPQGNNNILRNVTVAAGYGMRNWWDPGDPYPDVPTTPGADPAQIFPDNTVYDGMDIAGTNIMIDHVTALYATDEAISMNEVANNVTVQFSNVSQGQNYPQWDAEGGGLTGHALGSLLEAGNSTAQAAISFHHNLYAHQKARVPQLQKGGLGGYYDFRNNVFYNWFGTAGSKGGTTFLNLVNNFYLAGDGGDQPNGGTDVEVGTQGGGTGVLNANSSIYRNGNLLDSNKDDDALDGNPLPAGDAANPLWKGGVATYAGSTDAAAQAFDRVLNYMGANWWTRDSVIDTPDERIIDEARRGTGRIKAWADDPWNNDPAEGVEWRALKSTPQTSRGTDWDTESSVGYGIGDGMPTYWELEHGLDPDARDDTGDFDSDGYTNLEEYLNDIAAWPAADPIVFDGTSNGRYAQVTNWDANADVTFDHPWQPSRFDTAVVNGGTVTVDAVGQHAGNLLLGTNADNTVTFNISDGWLKVEDAPHGLSTGTVVIADHAQANATLNLSGGKLTTENLLKGAGGEFNFTGGTLTAATVGLDLVNDGGTIAPGESAGTTHVMGDLELNGGTLEIEIGGTDWSEYDRVIADGVAYLGGTLKVSLIEPEEGAGVFIPQLGNMFGFLVSAGTDDMFTDFDLPDLEEGLQWTLLPGDATTFLAVVPAAGLPGDYNGDNSVDAADYATWRDNVGNSSLPFNETASPGIVDEADYNEWRANFGATLDTGGGSSNAVPEPVATIMVGQMAIVLFLLRRQRSVRAGR